MNAEISDRVLVLVEEVQKDMKSDVFDFAGEFHRAYPKEWHRKKARWDDIFPGSKSRSSRMRDCCGRD